MIDYKLAKKLKDAGFPQKFDGPFKKDIDALLEGDDALIIEECIESGESERERFVKAPTLSELIKACGDWFKKKDTDTNRGIYYDKYLDEWNTFEKSELLEDLDEITCGKTPEEAVARLFLRLNDDKIKNNDKSKKKREKNMPKM